MAKFIVGIKHLVTGMMVSSAINPIGLLEREFRGMLHEVPWDRLKDSGVIWTIEIRAVPNQYKELDNDCENN